MQGRGWTLGEISIEVTTLLGLDEHPACVPGWEFLHPSLARQIVARMLSAEWRFAVCAEDGRLLHAGITRRRPRLPAARSGRAVPQADARPRRDARRGGIVELQITWSRLLELACRSIPVKAWSGVLGDLVRQTRTHLEPHSGWDEEAGSGRDPHPRRVPRPGHESACDRDIGHDLDHSRGLGRDKAGRRRADAVLRRYIQIRGRVCSWPGCRVPATKTDQDHIVEWSRGGPTREDNLELACRHDHRAKHEGGWRVTRSESGVLVWTSPLGHAYPVELAPIMIPLPDPQPRDWPNTPPDRLPEEPGPTMVAGILSSGAAVTSAHGGRTECGTGREEGWDQEIPPY